MPPISWPVSCCGKKPFGIDDEQIDVQATMPSSITTVDRPVLEHPVERALVAARACASNARSPSAQSGRALLRACGRRITRAHHRRRRQRDHERDQHRAADSVTANSRNSRPTMPPMNSSGMNTATSDTLIVTHGEADLACAEQRGLNSASCPLEVPRHVLEHHDRVVDDEARRDGERHQRQVVQGYSRARYMTPKRAEQRQRRRQRPARAPRVGS